VILIIAGLAPVGVPILSDNTWRLASPQAEAAASVAQPFTYEWGTDGSSTRVTRSDDGGRTWHAVTSIPQPISQIEAVRGDEETVLARSADAIWISRDGGTSWTQTAALPSRPLSMAVDDKASGALFVGTESAGLLVSRDLGATWQAVPDAALADGGAAPVAITALAVNDEDNTIVYAASGIWLGTSQARLTPIGTFVSVDGGSHWLQMESLPLGASPTTDLSPVEGHPLSLLATDTAGIRSIDMKLTPDLLAQLDNTDAGERAAAARAIGLIGDRAALPTLLGHLEDPNLLAGDAIAGAIGQSGDQSTVPTLLNALSSTDDAMRARAAYALGLLKADSATPQLAAALLSGGPMVARRAGEALAAIGTDEAMKALVAPLADSGTTPALQAAMIGLEAAGEKAVPALMADLQDSQATARANAAEMLGWLKAAPATSVLAKALTDADPAVRDQAAWALGEIATPEAQQILAKALTAETDTVTRQATTSALAHAKTLAGNAGTTTTSFWSGLLEAATTIPPSRWTLLVLFVMLAAALLLAGPRRTHLPHN